MSHLIKFSGGDARTLINALEMAIETIAENDTKEININLNSRDAIQRKILFTIKMVKIITMKAFIKSIRGSDPDATLFWLGEYAEVGEDPILF